MSTPPPPPPPPDLLIPHLLTHASFPSLFARATQSAFLEKAGKGELGRKELVEWLRWDRVYTQGYVRFVGLLVAGLRAEGGVEVGRVGEELMDLLISSLTNVRREVKFFEATAEAYGLDISVAESKVVGKGQEAEVESEGLRLYGGVFRVGERIERGEVGWLEGLVALWGTEICYLTSWRYAKSFISSSSTPQTFEKDKDGGALRKEFIDNWTCDEFVAFVDEIERLLERVWKLSLEGKEVGRWAPERKAGLEGVEEVWRGVLEAEIKFWPVVGEE